MFRKSLPVFIAISCLSNLAHAKDIDLIVNGLDGKLKDNVDVYLSSIPEKDYSADLRFQSRLEDSINEALNALGYYNAEISFDYEKESQELKVNVVPGEPVTVAEVDVELTGEAKSDPDFIKAVQNSRLEVGSVLHHSDYEALKSKLRNLALKKGYFNAKYDVSRLEVSPVRNQAFIRLHYDSGQRYHFGETTITGSQIELDRVQSLQPYKQGEPYLVSEVGKFNSNLSNTDWFSSVVVAPDLSKLDSQRELPMNVSLAPQSRNQLETGIGYSTDVGVRGSLKWNKPWVNSRGHSFDSSFSLSKPEQTITAGYRIPLDDVLHQYYRIQYGMKKVDNRDTNSLESNLQFERHWLADKGWHKTVYLRYLIENYEQGLQDDIGQFVMPGISFSRTRTRGGSMPSWGDKQSITFEYGDKNVFSETSVLRIIGSSSWIRSLGDNHRGLWKVNGGVNLTDEFDRLSPSLRFFAGGDNSIRGYGYESISPVDSSNSLTGAKYLLTNTLEYQYRLTGDWWGALFYDTGDAFNDTPDLKDGVGFGVRWASPVGPIALDFAWGLDSDPGDRFQIHFSLGPEL
ncbi:autotransporter secretion outer membrane protein TamA [Vibrio xiamenensis]|uniref:Translocation and assembly module subunit TamA n=1 Tax=Vibrio xiamenensis TaxID=861298 RepID=A0A1G8BET7_9VIBR|nr:autotransporter assembly complex family protein [Vibrio xiamenensis]SDH31678.1 autotransporter secretion outer membrane protein TamA [Vibrio xiamenensis]